MNALETKNVKKEYVPLTKLTDKVRERCQAIMENHMQCPRMGDVLCVDNTGEEARELQFCLFHSVLEQQKDQDNPEYQVKKEHHPIKDIEKSISDFIHPDKEKKDKPEKEEKPPKEDKPEKKEK